MLFSIIWLWQRNKTKENVSTRTVSQKIAAFSGYVIIFSALYLPLFFTKGTVAESIIPQYDIIQNFGVLLCVCGIFTSIWSRLLLGWNWSGGVTAKKDHELIVTGPYRFVRHPIYTGFIAALIGTCLVTGGIVGIVITGLYIFGLYAKINKEEQLLADLFGDVYSDYQKRTCKLIPFLW
ncbi:methyltransferase family protein [Sinomicrobium weinanense]|uniref:methyltransferase family protein n=1 Tax=Sinomicrobium weinanense TaxID=2842200 RepID=UPI001C0D16F8|nr:isoprenylcysteine carboxylmethyltransferase family protein [Sinomicrobium weinanense]MBU3122638.1 isoprenylcysteine carboxylmethyltransferase family protein [Sinomicrobium weinanense]